MLRMLYMRMQCLLWGCTMKITKRQLARIIREEKARLQEVGRIDDIGYYDRYEGDNPPTGPRGVRLSHGIGSAEEREYQKLDAAIEAAIKTLGERRVQNFLELYRSR